MPESKHIVLGLVVLILAVIGIIWLLNNLWTNWKVSRVNNWPKTDATIQRIYATPMKKGDDANVYITPDDIGVVTNNSMRFKINALYTYNVDGKTYQSDKLVYYGKNEFTAADTKAILAKLQQGSVVPVFYNPIMNSEAYLYNGNMNWTGTVIGIVFILIAIAVSIFASRMVKRGATNPNDTGALAVPNLSEIQSEAPRHDTMRPAYGRSQSKAKGRAYDDMSRSSRMRHLNH